MSCEALIYSHIRKYLSYHPLILFGSICDIRYCRVLNECRWSQGYDFFFCPLLAELLLVLVNKIIFQRFESEFLLYTCFYHFWQRYNMFVYQ